MWPLFHFAHTELEANRGVSGGASQNSIKFVTVEKLQKSPKLRNCRNHQSRETAQIVCNALTSAHALRCAEVNNGEKLKLKTKTSTDIKYTFLIIAASNSLYLQHSIQNNL